MITSNNLTRKFGSKTAVDGVSLTLEPGHVYAMLGPNGSGKTTWMKMAAGLVKPTGGQMLYKGRPVDLESRKEIAYMSTEPYFYTWMTARDVGKYYQDFFEDFSYERYAELLSRMELEENLKTKRMLLVWKLLRRPIHKRLSSRLTSRQIRQSKSALLRLCVR